MVEPFDDRGTRRTDAVASAMRWAKALRWPNGTYASCSRVFGDGNVLVV
jgi:hypothetical protein